MDLPLSEPTGLTCIDLSEIPHAWQKGTVVIVVVFPRDGETLCVTLPAAILADLLHTFRRVQEELKPEVMVLFEADGMPDGSHVPLAVFPDAQPLGS